jgi:hypothetical protein
MTAPHDNISKHPTDKCNKQAGDNFFFKYNTFVAQTTRKWLSRHTHNTFECHSTETDNAETIASEPRTITGETFARYRNNSFTTTTKLESFVPFTEMANTLGNL